MPVLLVRVKHNGVADGNLVGGLAPALNSYSALDDQEPLRACMFVPVCAPTILELDMVDVDRCTFGRGREQLDVGRSGEGLGVGRARGDVGVPEDTHDVKGIIAISAVKSRNNFRSS